MPNDISKANVSIRPCFSVSLADCCEFLCSDRHCDAFNGDPVRPGLLMFL